VLKWDRIPYNSHINIFELYCYDGFSGVSSDRTSHTRPEGNRLQRSLSEKSLKLVNTDWPINSSQTPYTSYPLISILHITYSGINCFIAISQRLSISLNHPLLIVLPLRYIPKASTVLGADFKPSLFLVIFRQFHRCVAVYSQLGTTTLEQFPVVCLYCVWGRCW